MGWPLATLGGWLLRSKPAPARSESSASSEEMVLYSQGEVQASLAMSAQVLRCKNSVILELSDQLEAALMRSPPAAAAHGACAAAGAAGGDSCGSAQLLADLAARCQEQQQQIAELRLQLQPTATAQAELAAAQVELAAARQQQEKVKAQLATVKLELADAQQAQGRAAGALAHVDAAIVQLRQEKEEVGAGAGALGGIGIGWIGGAVRRLLLADTCACPLCLLPAAPVHAHTAGVCLSHPPGDSPGERPAQAAG